MTGFRGKLRAHSQPGYVTLKVQMAEAGFSEEYMKNMFKLITGCLPTIVRPS